MEVKKIFKILKYLIGPIVFFILLLAPIDIEMNQKIFLAIFSTVISFWLFSEVPLFVSGIMGVCLSVICGVVSISEAFAPFANHIIFLFMGGFLLAKALEMTRLDQALAHMAMSMPWVKNDPKKIILVFLSLSFLLSMWISNTAAVAMLLPMALGLVKKFEKDNPESSAGLKESILLALAYSATLGGNATPIGSPPNVIAIGFLHNIAHQNLSFLEWMGFTIPVSLILFVAIYKISTYHIKTRNIEIVPETSSLPRYREFNIHQKNVVFIFSLTVFMWVAPSIIALVTTEGSTFNKFLNVNLNASVIGMFLASLLFLLPLRSADKVLKSEHITQIDWPSLLLFGSGLSLGQILFKTGLANIFATYITTVTGDLDIKIVFSLLIFITIFFTELASNTATANIILPIMLALGLQKQIDPKIISILFALSCNSAFMLPVATPPNAIVYGTNFVSKITMAKRGFVLNLLAWFIFTVILVIFA